MDTETLKTIDKKVYKGIITIERTGYGMFSGILCKVPNPINGKIGSFGEYLKISLPDGQVIWVTAN